MNDDMYICLNTLPVLVGRSEIVKQ